MHHDRAHRRSALDVNGRSLVSDISLDDLVTEGTSWGIPERRSRRVVVSTAEALAAALAEIDRGAHPGVSPHAWRVIDTRTAGATGPVTHPVGTGRSRRGPRRPR